MNDLAMCAARAAVWFSGLCLAVAVSGGAAAQDGGSDADQLTADANNPLARVRALNLQNYYIGNLTDIDEPANQFIVRYAQPLQIAGGTWLLRASMPLNAFPVPPDFDTEVGLGDFNVFAAYSFDLGDEKLAFGVGPLVTLPTATEHKLGSEKWSAGLANVFYDGRSPRFQYGYLLTWQGSFAGNHDRADVSVGALQPFAFFQFGQGTYLRTAPIWTYNFENDNYSVPVGIGIGHVIRREKTVFNFFAEPQVSIADRGANQPEWQVYLGLNMQFYN